MMILIPLEVPDDSEYLSLYAEAFSPSESKMIEREYEEVAIDELHEYHELFLEEISRDIKE